MEISSVHATTLIAAAVSPAATRTPEEQVANRQLVQAVKKLNEAEFLGANSELTFFVDRRSGRALVRIISKETNEVIQQIPPEYVLRMAEELNGHD